MIKLINSKSLYESLHDVVNLCEKCGKDNIDVIVPDKLSLFMEKFLLEKMNICSSFNIKVSTLNRFSKRSLIIDKEKTISKLGCIILVHKIMNENIQKLKELKSKAYSFTYAEEVFETISQLKASKISCEEMKKFSSANERLENKIQDLALIFEEYEKAKAGLLDSSDLFLMSAFYVAEGKKNSNIVFVGFDDFTAIEYSIIEQLSLVANVSVYNYKSKEKNTYIYNNEVESQLKNIAYINQLPFSVEQASETTGCHKVLQDNIYSIAEEKVKYDFDNLIVYSANNFKSEIEYVAREIRSQILNGKQYKNFGVAVFDLENKIDDIIESFEKYEINYYIDNQISLIKSVLYKFVVNVFKYNLEGYALPNLIDLIGSPFFSATHEQKRQIILRVKSLNFRGKIQDNNLLKIEDETFDLLIDFLNKIYFDPKDEISEILNKIKTSFDYEKVLNDLASLNVKDRILHQKSLSVINTVFDEILSLNKNVNIDEFFDIFSHVCEVVKINNLPLSLDCVKIVDANNSMEIFDHLFMVNCNKENAPNVKADCGIILDSEIEVLNFKNKLSPTISHINKLSRLRLFNSVLLFNQNLTISYSKNACEIINNLKKKFIVNIDGSYKQIPILTISDNDNYILSEMDLIENLCKNDKNNVKINIKTAKNKDFSNISAKSSNILKNLKLISPSYLESYFKCPFYCFLNNGIKIRNDFQPEILMVDIGNLLHEIVYIYYKKNKKVGDVYEFCKNEINKFIERNERLKLNKESPVFINLIDEAVRVVNALDYIDENSEFLPTYFEFEFNEKNPIELKNISLIGKVDRVDIFNDMLRIIDYKSGTIKPGLNELYYGKKLQLFLYSCAMENILQKKVVGCFYLPLHNKYEKGDENSYSLKGFYLAEDFVVKAFDKRLEAGGESSDIVSAKLKKDGTVSISSKDKQLTSNDFNILQEYSKKVSELAVDEIKSGYIKPSPTEKDCFCEYCPYVHVCLKNSSNVKSRPNNKVEIDSFKEVENEKI